MKGKVIRSFVDSTHGAQSEGDIIDIPPGVDWLRAGFVALLAPTGIENAALEPERTAVIKKSAARKPKAGTS